MKLTVVPLKLLQIQGEQILVENAPQTFLVVVFLFVLYPAEQQRLIGLDERCGDATTRSRTHSGLPRAHPLVLGRVVL